MYLTPITAIGCRQHLPLSVFQLKDKHCQRPHCRNGVVHRFGKVLLSNLYAVNEGHCRNLEQFMGTQTLEWPALWRITMNSLHNEGIYK